MIEIGKGRFVKANEVEESTIFEKEGKTKVCFVLKSGRTTFSDALENYQKAVELVQKFS